MGCLFLLVILLVGAAINYGRITVPILIIDAVAAGAWYVRRRRKRSDGRNESPGRVSSRSELCCTSATEPGSGSARPLRRKGVWSDGAILRSGDRDEFG
jgi:hypothetical protein